MAMNFSNKYPLFFKSIRGMLYIFHSSTCSLLSSFNVTLQLPTTPSSLLFGQSHNLVVLLDAGGGHAVDDGVPARIHVADGQADGEQGEEHDNSEPQDDVEDHGIVLLVFLGQVNRVLGLQLLEKQGVNIDISSNYHCWRWTFTS